jgi:hypothetical protein
VIDFANETDKNAVIFEAKMSGEINDKYAAMPAYEEMSWNWQELQDLINTYCDESQQQPSSQPTPETGSGAEAGAGAGGQVP